MKIALIAHDNKKSSMVSFVEKHVDFFRSCVIYSTGNTGKTMGKFNLPSLTILKSGPLGGDAQIAASLVEGKIDCVFFFIDPLHSHAHEVDIHMLLRLCNVYDIPLATNEATAECVVQILKSKNVQLTRINSLN